MAEASHAICFVACQCHTTKRIDLRSSSHSSTSEEDHERTSKVKEPETGESEAASRSAENASMSLPMLLSNGWLSPSDNHDRIKPWRRIHKGKRIYFMSVRQRNLVSNALKQLRTGYTRCTLRYDGSDFDKAPL